MHGSDPIVVRGCLPFNRRRLPIRWRFLLAPLAALLIASGSSVFAVPPGAAALQIAGRVDRHYNTLRSLEVHFVQHYNGMGMHRTESGVLLLKKPGKMRWTYTQPDGKLFILDGHDGYFYSPGESEAQKVPQKRLDDLRSPLRFLLGHTNLEKELIGLQVFPQSNGMSLLSGVPRGMEKRISSLRITATADGTIRSMSIEETDGVTNAFDFSGEVANAPAPSTAFVFVPPAGVHVVEGMPPV